MPGDGGDAAHGGDAPLSERGPPGPRAEPPVGETASPWTGRGTGSGAGDVAGGGGIGADLGAVAGADAPPEGPLRSSTHLALVLAATGGFVDAVGYIALYHLFTAHQSGNSDALGVALSGGEWNLAWPRATAIAAYVIGIGLGTLLVEQCRRHRPEWAGGTVALTETVALGGALAIGATATYTSHLSSTDPFPYAGAAALLACAMGLQTVSLRQVGRRTVRTTFVTGLLTNMTESFMVAMHTPRGPDRRQLLRFAGFAASVWLAYLTGAVAGGGAERVWSFDALSVPIAVIAVLAVWDFRHGYIPTLPAQGMPKAAE